MNTRIWTLTITLLAASIATAIAPGATAQTPIDEVCSLIETDESPSGNTDVCSGTPCPNGTECYDIEAYAYGWWACESFHQGNGYYNTEFSGVAEAGFEHSHAAYVSGSLSGEASAGGDGGPFSYELGDSYSSGESGGQTWFYGWHGIQGDRTDRADLEASSSVSGSSEGPTTYGQQDSDSASVPRYSAQCTTGDDTGGDGWTTGTTPDDVQACMSAGTAKVILNCIAGRWTD